MAIDQIAQSGLSSLKVIYYSEQLFRYVPKDAKDRDEKEKRGVKESSQSGVGTSSHAYSFGDIGNIDPLENKEELSDLSQFMTDSILLLDEYSIHKSNPKRYNAITLNDEWLKMKNVKLVEFNKPQKGNTLENNQLKVPTSVFRLVSELQQGIVKLEHAFKGQWTDYFEHHVYQNHKLAGRVNSVVQSHGKALADAMMQ